MSEDKKREFTKDPVRKPAEATPMQKEAIKNILSGKYKTAASAMKAAGYSEASAVNPQNNLFERKGVQHYLKDLDAQAKEKFGVNLPKKVMQVYMEGLEASDRKPRIVDRDEEGHPVYAYEEMPDHKTRKLFADQFAKFFGWMFEDKPAGPSQQFNFFSFPKSYQDKFNDKFKEMLREVPSG